jgi:hypothetical protein
MALRDQLENLSPREQRLLTVLASVFAALLFIGVPVYIFLNVSDARAENESIRDTLRNMERMSELLAKRKGERDARDLKYAKKAPPLGAFIESAARDNGLEVPESSDRPDDVGKNGYTERTTVVKMKKVGLLNLVRMLEKIEKSGYPVVISGLTVKTRASGPDSYDVTLAVSAFDRQAGEEKAEGAAEPKGKAAPNSSKGREL